MSSKSQTEVINSFFRQCFYALVLLGGVYLMHFLTGILKTGTFQENGIVENLQIALLLGAAVLFLVQAMRYREHAAFLCCLAALCAFASIRELNNLLDQLIPLISWKFAFILPTAAMMYAIKNNRQWQKSFMIFLSFPALYMMMGAMIVFIPIAQCIGHSPFIRNALGQSNVSDIKELFEEATETVAYLWIFLSSTESFFNFKSLYGKK